MVRSWFPVLGLAIALLASPAMGEDASADESAQDPAVAAADEDGAVTTRSSKRDRMLRRKKTGDELMTNDPSGGSSTLPIYKDRFGRTWLKTRRSMDFTTEGAGVEWKRVRLRPIKAAKARAEPPVPYAPATANLSRSQRVRQLEGIVGLQPSAGSAPPRAEVAGQNVPAPPAPPGGGAAATGRPRSNAFGAQALPPPPGGARQGPAPAQGVAVPPGPLPPGARVQQGRPPTAQGVPVPVGQLPPGATVQQGRRPANVRTGQGNAASSPSVPAAPVVPASLRRQSVPRAPSPGQSQYVRFTDAVSVPPVGPN